MSATTHQCPGCGKGGVPLDTLACVRCWYRLPAALRNAVRSTYSTRLTDRSLHRAALRAALIWYRENYTGKAEEDD